MTQNIIVLPYLDCVRRVVNDDETVPFGVISIQDSSGFGFRFVPERQCKDVLTLQFDDVDTVNETFCSGKVANFDEFAKDHKLFTEDDAKQIVEFCRRNEDKINKLYIHCYAGISRSSAVAAAISKYYFNDDSKWFATRIPNMRVYRLILNAFHDE